MIDQFVGFCLHRRVAILSGLKAGEQVVTRGGILLND